MTVKTIVIAKGKKCQLQIEILQPAKQRAILTTTHLQWLGQSYSRNISKQHIVVLFEVIQRNNNRLSQFMKANTGSIWQILLWLLLRNSNTCVLRKSWASGIDVKAHWSDTFLTDNARMPDTPLCRASHPVRHKSTKVPDLMEFSIHEAFCMHWIYKPG